MSRKRKRNRKHKRRKRVEAHQITATAQKLTKIAFVGQPEYFRCMYENDLDGLYDVREFRMAWGVGPEHYRDLVEFQPDVAFFFRPELYPNETIKALKGATVSLSSEPIPKHIMGHYVSSYDMECRHNSLREARGKYDFFFHYDKTSIRFLRQIGMDVDGEFLFPVATDVYRPLNVNKFWDWGFFGRDTEHRERFLGVAKRDFEGLHVAHGVYGRQFIELMNLCKIGINVHVDQNISLEHRMHNMMACGVMVMSEPLSHNDLLKPGIHYVEFSQPQEFLEKLKYYLENKSERERIADNGLKLIQETLSAKVVFPRLINYVLDQNARRAPFRQYEAIALDGQAKYCQVSLARLEKALPHLAKPSLTQQLVGQWRNFKEHKLPQFTLRRKAYNAVLKIVKFIFWTRGRYLGETIVSRTQKIKEALFPQNSRQLKWARKLGGFVLKNKAVGKRHLSEILAESSKKHGLDSDSTTIGIILPNLTLSGGTMVLCEHANRLVRKGYNVIMIDNRLGKLKVEIDWFPNFLPLVTRITDIELDCPLDIIMATHWTTAFAAVDFPARNRFYFIQSDETHFTEPGTLDHQLTLDTYTYPFKCIVIAKWLGVWLEERFLRQASYVPNGIEPQMFWPDKPMKPKSHKLRVLLEGAIDYPFKGMKKAFEVVHGMDCEVWCISSEGTPKPGWKCDRFFHRVPFGEMRRIYSSCDVLIKMSTMEGFFMPPLEMMACGGTVITNKVTGYDEYIVDGYNGLVVEQGDVEAARECLRRLIDDRLLLEKLKKGGTKTARQWSWQRSNDILEQVLRNELGHFKDNLKPQPSEMSLVT